MSELEQQYEQYAQTLKQHGQAHLLRFWDDLSDALRRELLCDLAEIDLETCAPLVDQYVRNKPPVDLPDQVEPPPILPAAPDADRAETYKRAREAGDQAIRDGKVAAFVVAGGQGTRLGFDGPKGAFPISPIREAVLFQLFAEFLLGIERIYGKRPPWYVMTSPQNHTATMRVFEEHTFFGLSRDDVIFFKQGQMPAFDRDGKILLSEKHRVALSPDGHGGSLTALRRSGALDDMKKRGIEHVSYFQVDNPLVKLVDPLFIGLHTTEGSEMSSKALPKASDQEKVGNFVLADGKLSVIEYSDLPDELATAKNPDGSRKFDAGSIAIHVLERSFIERLTDASSDIRLPWHRAEKKVPYVDGDGNKVTPDEPNAVKLEMFVFDALPLSKDPLVMYTRRDEEFSPVKNAEGVDSAQSARRDMVRRAGSWLEACGVAVPRDDQGEPATTIEITPAFAIDAEDLCNQMQTPPDVKPGEPLLLA
jgi:UDP-N-acetylglucosamine/UDP-N-acetylgalactosamine diphosphorylase